MRGRTSTKDIDAKLRSARHRSELSRLAVLWPCELQGEGRQERLRLLSRLRTALRQERRRGLAGHWSYDLARHAQLVAAYRAEVRRFMADFGSDGGDMQPPCGVVTGPTRAPR